MARGVTAAVGTPCPATSAATYSRACQHRYRPYRETIERLKLKYKKYSSKEQKELIKKEVQKIKKLARYVSDGDYIAQTYGIMLDAYYRDMFVQKKYNCLYGRCWYDEPYDGIDYPYGDKHWIAIINFLLKKGIVKYK